MKIKLSVQQVNSLRELVNEKADDIFLRLSSAEQHGATPDRVEALRGTLAYWNAIDTAVRDWTPDDDGDPKTEEQPANPEPYKLGGVPLFDIAADIARTQQRMILNEDRAEGRVISPRPVRSNIHD